MRTNLLFVSVICVLLPAQFGSLSGCTPSDAPPDDSEKSTEEPNSESALEPVACEMDEDCVIATDWAECGGCPKAFSASYVESQSCVGTLADKSGCGSCPGNADCGYTEETAPTGVECRDVESVGLRCVLTFESDGEGGAGGAT